MKKNVKAEMVKEVWGRKPGEKKVAVTYSG